MALAGMVLLIELVVGTAHAGAQEPCETETVEKPVISQILARCSATEDALKQADVSYRFTHLPGADFNSYNQALATYQLSIGLKHPRDGSEKFVSALYIGNELTSGDHFRVKLEQSRGYIGQPFTTPALLVHVFDGSQHYIYNAARDRGVVDNEPHLPVPLMQQFFYAVPDEFSPFALMPGKTLSKFIGDHQPTEFISDDKELCIEVYRKTPYIREDYLEKVSIRFDLATAQLVSLTFAQAKRGEAGYEAKLPHLEYLYSDVKPVVDGNLKLPHKLVINEYVELPAQASRGSEENASPGRQGEFVRFAAKTYHIEITSMRPTLATPHGEFTPPFKPGTKVRDALSSTDYIFQ